MTGLERVVRALVSTRSLFGLYGMKSTCLIELTCLVCTLTMVIYLASAFTCRYCSGSARAVSLRFGHVRGIVPSSPKANNLPVGVVPCQAVKGDVDVVE